MEKMWNNKNFIILKVLLWCITSISYKVFGQDVIDCSSMDVITSVLNDPIDLNFSGTVKVYENVAINEILSTSNNEFAEKYLDARLVSIANDGQAGAITKNLVIFTTENFKDYARKQNASRILLKINLGCNTGRARTIILLQPFKEGNYFSPIFSQSLYELTLPLPAFNGFELTRDFQISARDDDLENNQINFTSITSSLHHINVRTMNLTSDDKKTFFVNLTLERIFMELPQQIEFVIIATDNGIPPRSSNATVIIRPDPLHTMPKQPRFDQKLYKGFINVAFAMDPIPIKLTEDSYDPQIQFTLTGSAMDGFEMLDTGNGSLEILWNATKVNRSYIMANKQWQLEVKAEHPQLRESTVATVLVELANFQSFFHFMSMYSDGHIDKDNNLHISPIIFYPFIYKPDINFMLLDNPHNMFNVSNEGFRVKIELMANFSLDAFANNSFIKLALQASWEQLSSVCYIVIELPQQQQQPQQHQQMLQFEKPLYVGNLTTDMNNRKLEMESIVVHHTEEVNATQLYEFQLIGEWSHLFHLNVNGSHVKLEINETRNVTNEENLQLPILLILEVKTAVGKALTSLVINSQQGIKSIEWESKDIFESKLVMGKLLLQNGTQMVLIEPILLKPLKNLTNYEFAVEESELSDKFLLYANLTSHRIQLLLNDSLANKTLEENHFLRLNISANLKESGNSTDAITVLLELPEKKCPFESPLPLNTSIIVEGNYVFTTHPNETGSLGFINAFAKDSNSSLIYNLEVDNKTLAQNLTVNPFSGELFLYGSLFEGKHKFNVTMENLISHEKAKVQALLKIEKKEECKIYKGPAVEQTLVVKHIDEERPYNNLWNMTYAENCSYYVIEVWPKEKAYIYINESSSTLDIYPVDREDPVFAEMLEAEIIVKMKLTCQGEGDTESIIPFPDALLLDNVTRFPRSLSWPFDYISSPQNISFSADIMWLHLKIDDINDNAPEFQFKNGPQYLGYPAGKIAFDVYPEYLTQVKAIDHDLGINAKIRYSIRDNEYFAIEPETGKIYPKGRVLQPQQQKELIILAVDQDGKGLMTGTVIIVKSLADDFYSLVTIEGNSSKTLEEISRELSKEIGCEVKILKMYIVPQIEERSRITRASRHKLVCKAWIYAYRDQELVHSNELQKNLEMSPSSNILTIESYEQAGLQSSTKQKTPSNVGYVVAISMLSVISCSSIGFIIYQYCFHNNEESVCGAKGNLNVHHIQHSSLSSGHHRGNDQGTVSSYGDNNPNHLKLSSFGDNIKTSTGIYP